MTWKGGVLALCGTALLGWLLGARMQELAPEPWGGLLSFAVSLLVGTLLGVAVVEVVVLRVTGEPMRWGVAWRRLRGR